MSSAPALFVSLAVWFWAVEVHSMTVPPTTTKFPWDPYAPDNQCRQEPIIMELCQRCAVKTRSNIVYPMCCRDLEAAQDWCRAYLSFGRRSEVPVYTLNSSRSSTTRSF